MFNSSRSMSGNLKVSVTLSKTQKSKLKSAHKNNKSVKIRLSNEQLKGSSDEIIITPKQHKKIQSALRAKKPRGVTLLFTSSQIGGFLSLLAGVLGPMLLNGVINAAQRKNFFTGRGVSLPGHTGGRITYASKKKSQCKKH